MTVVSDPNASVLDQEERAVLFGAFLNVDDQRLDIERFRIKHKKRIPVIDRLIERKFMAAEGVLYRVTLDGLYALNNDATRAVIQAFNTILPVLASMYEQEGSRKQWTPHEIGEHAFRCDGLMVNEHALGRVLWYLLSHVPISSGWTRTEPAEIASFTLVEAVLSFPELPLERGLSVPVTQGLQRTQTSRAAMIPMDIGIKIFISHSSRDVGLVTAFVDLLLAALPVRKNEIRCTSVPGCRLRGGSDPADVLVDDIRNSMVFVGLVTKDSVEAPFVLFELGARWGNRGRIIPVLGPQADYDLLPGPVRPLNALKTSDRGDMHQLITEIAQALAVDPDSPDAYHSELDILVTHRPAASGSDPRTVAEIFAQKSKLKEKMVTTRGRVVKFNLNIMGRNWIHLQDGTGGQDENDITVTTADRVEVGDVVFVKGVLRLEKDFGAGYAYPVIIEDAKVTR